MMTKDEILAFVNENPVSFFATAEGNVPHVRAMMTFRANEEGLFVSTFTHKEIYKQVLANPAVELCYFSPDKKTQVRVSGRAEVLNDLELKKQVVQNFPFLKPVIEKEGYDIMGIFRIAGGKATVWSEESAFEPKEFIEM